ncbi:hypothetical protein BHS00_06965 [Lactococcus carnosus]|nr:hypothetical protein BHS00_06965 [Lactococcus carnosus]
MFFFSIFVTYLISIVVFYINKKYDIKILYQGIFYFVVFFLLIFFFSRGIGLIGSISFGIGFSVLITLPLIRCAYLGIDSRVKKNKGR